MVAAERLALRLPLRPGVWTVSLYIRQSVPRGYTEYIPGSRTHFYVSPLNFAYSKVVTKNTESLNKGVAEDDEINDKQKPLKVGMNRGRQRSGRPAVRAGPARNSGLRAGPGLDFRKFRAPGRSRDIEPGSGIPAIPEFLEYIQFILLG